MAMVYNGRIKTLTDDGNKLNPTFTTMYPETMSQQVLDFDYATKKVIKKTLPGILNEDTTTINKLKLIEGLDSSSIAPVNGYVMNAVKDMQGNQIDTTYSTKEEVNALKEQVNECMLQIASLQAQINQLTQ